MQNNDSWAHALLKISPSPIHRHLKMAIVISLIEQHASSSQVCMTLKAARAAQRLQIPQSDQQRNGGNQETSDEKMLGSSEHWLGVPPSSCLLSPSSITDQHKVVQTMKVKLDELASRISPLIRSSASPSVRDQNQDSSLEDLTKVISDRKDALRSKRIQCLLLTKKILRDTLRLILLYKTITDKALSFAQDAILSHQPRLDQTNIDYDASWTSVMEAKLMAMESQMELQTYGNPKHLLALSKVHQLITKSMAKVEEETKQVMSKLDCYHALGPAFEVVAVEYGRVLRQLHETQGMIARFNEMETDLNQEMNCD